VLKINATSTNENTQTLKNTFRNSELDMKVATVDFNGKIVIAPFILKGNKIPITDEIKTLHDGSIAWTDVDQNGDLTIFKVNAYKN